MVKVVVAAGVGEIQKQKLLAILDPDVEAAGSWDGGGGSGGGYSVVFTLAFVGASAWGTKNRSCCRTCCCSWVMCLECTPSASPRNSAEASHRPGIKGCFERILSMLDRKEVSHLPVPAAARKPHAALNKT
eukprot:877705-Pelagomonas_calceolata.AAC.1